MLAILAIFFQGYLIQGGKNIVAFCSTLQNSTDCLKLEDLSDSMIVDFKIESVLQVRRKKKVLYKLYNILCKAHEKMGDKLQLTLNNSKSEERQGDYQDKTQNLSKAIGV